MSSSSILIAIVAVVVVAVLASRAISNRKNPKARFYPGDKLSVSWGSLTVHCSYWVEWGEDRWHVDIDQVEDKSGSAPKEEEYLLKLVAFSLRGGKNQDIYIAGKKVVPGSIWPEPSQKNA